MFKNIFFIMYLLSLIGVLISVAFMILLERKVLSYIQIRKGPNKVGMNGIIQSFSDALKLFMKEQMFPVMSNYLVYYLSPVFMLFLILFMWLAMPLMSSVMNFFLGGLFFLSCTSMGVYSLIGSGWSSNSNYSMIGSMRGIAQSVSYEVSMFFFLLCLFMLLGSYNLIKLNFNQYYLVYFFLFIPGFLCWLTIMMAETNRTPFDFAEGESELVSGFNVEYMSGGFALLFLSEYASIIFMSFLIIFLFFFNLEFNFIILSFLGIFFCFSFIWIRGCFPRYRYDKLMMLAWKIFLPLSLFSLILFMNMKFMV